MTNLSQKTETAYLAAIAILRDAGVETFIVGVVENAVAGKNISTHASGKNNDQALLACQISSTVMDNFKRVTKATEGGSDAALQNKL